MKIYRERETKIYHILVAQALMGSPRSVWALLLRYYEPFAPIQLKAALHCVVLGLSDCKRVLKAKLWVANFGVRK